MNSLTNLLPMTLVLDSKYSCRRCTVEPHTQTVLHRPHTYVTPKLGLLMLQSNRLRIVDASYLSGRSLQWHRCSTLDGDDRGHILLSAQAAMHMLVFAAEMSSHVDSLSGPRAGPIRADEERQDSRLSDALSLRSANRWHRKTRIICRAIISLRKARNTATTDLQVPTQTFPTTEHPSRMTPWLWEHPPTTAMGRNCNPSPEPWRQAQNKATSRRWRQMRRMRCRFAGIATTVAKGDGNRS
jgi:hypothetical protein